MGNIVLYLAVNVDGYLEDEQGKVNWLSIIPTVLGKGIRLFPELSQELPLTLAETKSYNGIVDLVYEKRCQQT